MGYDEKEFGFELGKISHDNPHDPNSRYYSYSINANVKLYETHSGKYIKGGRLMKSGKSAGRLSLEATSVRWCRKRSEPDYQKMKADRLAVIDRAAAEKKSAAAQAEIDAAESLKSPEFS